MPVKGLRRLLFRKIAERNFAPPTEELRQEIVDLAHRRGRDVEDFAAELRAELREWGEAA